MRVATREEEVVQLLFEVAEAQAVLAVLRGDRALALAELEDQIPVEIRSAMEDVDEEYAPSLEEGDSRLADLRKRARLAATQYGETVKGERTQAVVYEKVTWDDVALRRFLVDRLDARDLSFALQLRTCKLICQIRESK